MVTFDKTLTKTELITKLKSGTSKVQIPIPIEQTDFDIYPIDINNNEQKRSYVVNCIPKAYNSLKELCKGADLKLCKVEVSFLSQSYLLLDEISDLDKNEMIFILELKDNCSFVSCATQNGLIQIGKIPSIKTFPEINEDSKDLIINFQDAENNIIASENYYKIKKLDLKVFLGEFKTTINSFIKKIILTSKKYLFNWFK